MSGEPTSEEMNLREEIREMGTVTKDLLEACEAAVAALNTGIPENEVHFGTSPRMVALGLLLPAIAKAKEKA